MTPYIQFCKFLDEQRAIVDKLINNNLLCLQRKRDIERFMNRYCQLEQFYLNTPIDMFTERLLIVHKDIVKSRVEAISDIEVWKSKDYLFFC